MKETIRKSRKAKKLEQLYFTKQLVTDLLKEAEKLEDYENCITYRDAIINIDEQIKEIE